MHARGGLEHERSDDVASHRRKDPSCAIMRCSIREKVANLIRPRVLRYLSVSSVNSGVTLVPRCAACRALVQLLHASTKETLQHPAQMQALRRQRAPQYGSSRRAVEVRATAQRMRSILPCALAQHAARLPSRRVLRACRGVETRAAPVPPVEAGPCLSGAQREVSGRVS